MLRMLLSLLALAALSAPLSAEIYKCRLQNGQTEIANTPCPTGSQTITTRPDERVSEAARQQAEREVQRMRSYVEKREAMQRAADDTAARDERAASQRQPSVVSPAPPPPRRYGSAEECLIDVGQMTLEASERARLEADCHNIATPQAVYVPLGVPSSAAPHPQHHHPEPVPKAEPFEAPKIAMPPLQR